MAAFTAVDAGSADIDEIRECVRDSNAALDTYLWGIYIGANEKHVGNVSSAQ